MVVGGCWEAFSSLCQYSNRICGIQRTLLLKLLLNIIICRGNKRAVK